MDDLFDVWFFYPDETHTKERSQLTADQAIRFAMQATQRPAAKIGILRQIMITDASDFCSWHWKFGEGVVFPPKPPEAA